MERIRQVISLALCFALGHGQFSQTGRGGGAIATGGGGLPTATVVLTFDESSNGNASNGDAPNKDFYTNCVETCPAGSPSPPVR